MRFAQLTDRANLLSLSLAPSSTSRMARRGLFRWALPALLALPALIGCEAVSAAAPDGTVAVTALLQTEQAAWNVNDSATYAAAYSDDADFINVRGQIFTGKTAIAGAHAMIFAGPFKGSNIVITVRTLKTLAPGVMLVDTDQTVTKFAFLPPGSVETTPGVLLTHFKYVAVYQLDGSWKFTSGQNTSVLPS